jgi:hypothetical protein
LPNLILIIINLLFLTFLFYFFLLDKSRSQSENQFQLLGKCVENFNRVCDLLIVNLRTAYEAQSIYMELRNYARFYAFVGPDRTENPPIYSINNQMQRIVEFKSALQRFISAANTGSPTALTTAPTATVANVAAVIKQPNQI